MTGAAGPHPLDRPVWNALATRQRELAIGDERARRFAPDIGPFAAAADDSPDSLAALAALGGGPLWLVEPREAVVPPGFAIERRAACLQMIADGAAPDPPAAAFEALGDADAPAMRALAAATRPGPFLARTHRLGGFIGVKEDGRLVAMAGERMKPEGFCEVSGVCTDPAHQARGHAGRLMRAVMAGIRARGETPFLHVYADNPGAAALYATLGFRVRRTVMLTVITPPAQFPIAS